MNIPNILNGDYTLSIGGINYPEFLTGHKNERLIMPMSVNLTRLSDKALHIVSISEAFDCCGKLYAYNFGVSDMIMTRKLLEVILDIAKHMDYTYVGLIHQTDTGIVDTARKLGFSEIVRFKNNRSGNELSEMCYIYPAEELIEN